MSEVLDNFLAHYGVPGMKWGRHKIATASERRKAPGHADHVELKTIKTQGKTGGTKSLSNAQMKTAIARMNLEQQYSTLNVKNSPIAKVKRAIDGIFKNGKDVRSIYNDPTTVRVREQFHEANIAVIKELRGMPNTS